jgi:predicted ArsR family transcriptional regulator
MIGLAPAAVRAYRMLLRLPTASVGDLAAGLGMSMMDVRAALRGLEAKGLVGRLPGAANRFRAATPGRAIDRSLAPPNSADSRQTDGRHLGDRSSVQLVTGADSVREQADRLIASAAADVCVASQGVPDGLAGLGASVRIRAIHPRAAMARSGAQDRIAALLGGGHAVRTTDRLPIDMLVVDRSVALLPVHGAIPEGSITSAVLVWPGGLYDTLLTAFERAWSTGAALQVRDGVVAESAGDGVPTADDLRLLDLLLDGLTDQAIAGRLGVGERTVQRRVRDLIDAVGVQTRIQLIWQASQRGWI